MDKMLASTELPRDNAPATLGAGGIFRPARPELVEIRALRSDEPILNRAFAFALDAEGRPAWPFRRFYIQGGLVFVQRWRLTRWIYDDALLPLVAGQDDQWMRASEPAVDRWIRRTAPAASIAPPPMRALA